MKARAFFLALFAFAALAFPAQAQIGGGVQQHGQVAQGSTDCAQWAGPGQISDSGSGCGGGGSGTVTSVGAGCGSSTGGSPITTTGNVVAVENPSTRTTGNFTTADCGNLINYNSASDQRPTLPTAASAGNGAFISTCNIGSHTQTITASGADTINFSPNTTYAMNQAVPGSPPSCARFTADGVSNWSMFAGSLSVLTATGTGLNTAASISMLGNNSQLSSGGHLLFSDAQNQYIFGTSNATIPGVWLGNTTELAWSSTAPYVNNSADTFLIRAAAAVIQQGEADAASPVAQTLQFQSVVAGTTNTAGVNTTILGSRGTGTGPSGNLIFEVGITGTTGSTQNTAAAMLSVLAGSATTAAIQFGNGSTFTKYDSCTALTTSATGVVACTASAMRLKNPLSWGVSTDLSALRPASWKYKDPQQFGEGEFVGLYADDVEKMDPRCVVYDHGLLKDYRDRCVIAHLVATVQAQQQQIESMKREIHH